MRKIILLLALLSTGAVASPDPLDKIYIDLHLMSIHKTDGFVYQETYYETNSNNIGLGITIPAHFSDGEVDPNVSYRFGIFKNSYSATSLYAALSIHSEYSNGLGGGIMFGAVSGYEAAPDTNDLIPAIVPTIHYIYNAYKAEMGLLYSKFNPALTLTISYSF